MSNEHIITSNNTKSKSSNMYYVILRMPPIVIYVFITLTSIFTFVFKSYILNGITCFSVVLILISNLLMNVYTNKITCNYITHDNNNNNNTINPYENKSSIKIDNSIVYWLRFNMCEMDDKCVTMYKSNTTNCFINSILYIIYKLGLTFHLYTNNHFCQQISNSSLGSASVIESQGNPIRV